MGGLTTHVLDTAHGRPAGGVRIGLYAADAPRHAIAAATTNADGRCDAPLLAGEDFKEGVYELAYHVGDYFRDAGLVLPHPPFLDVVIVRFGIASGDQHYHVPLLVSPFGYSTYRGS